MKVPLGVNWIDPENLDPNEDIKNTGGGLELYVNAKKVGVSIAPLARPTGNNQTAKWTKGKPYFHVSFFNSAQRLMFHFHFGSTSML